MEKPREKQGKAAEEGQRATSGLTTKLHTTAESVMKWKTQLEGEIKQRDGKIAECQEMVKNIKNSLLSQQQHSEALSHKLQLELLRRGDINLRIETTRNICSSLQQHCSYMSETMKKCFEEKDVIKTAQVEYVSELERLIESNENCHVAVEKLTREKDELERIYLLEKRDRLKMLEDCSNLKKLFQVKMEEARTSVLNQTERATKLAEHLEVSEEKVKSLNLHNSLLEQQIQKSEELLKEKEHELNSELGELQSLLKQKSDLLEEEMKKISSLEEQFTELSSQHLAMEAEKNSALEREVAHKMEIQELSLELQSLAQIREDTTKQIEKLVAEKSVLEERLESMAILEDEIVQLKQQLEVTTTEKESLACKLSLAEEEKNSTEQALEQSRKDLQEMNAELAKVKTDLETLSEANKDLQQIVESKEAALLKELETNRQLQESLDLQMQENGHLQKSLESLSSASASETGEMSKQLRELNGSLAKTKSQLKQKQDLVSNMTVEIESLKSDLTELGQALKNEQDLAGKQAMSLQKKLDEKENELKICQAGQTTLKETLQSLQEDLEGLNVQLKESTDEREALATEKKELEKTLKSLRSEKNSAETKLKRLETKAANLEKEKKELKEKISKARSENLETSEKKDQALNDFEEKIKEKEDQIAELEQTINDLKSANEDDLKGKDSKLVEVQSEKKKLSDKMETLSKEKVELESKVSRLSSQLADTIKNLNEMSSKYEAERQKLRDRIKSSQEQLTAKSDQVTKLQSQLDSQSSVLTTAHFNPASPSTSSSGGLGVPKNAVSQRLTSIMKGSNRTPNAAKGSRKISFSDTVNYISLEDDETSSISSGPIPTTPVKTNARAEVTTPRKQMTPMVPRMSTPQKGISTDLDGAGDEWGEGGSKKQMQFLRGDGEAVKTPAKRLLVTPTVNTTPKKARLGGTGNRTYKALDIN